MSICFQEVSKKFIAAATTRDKSLDLLSESFPFLFSNVNFLRRSIILRKLEQLDHQPGNAGVRELKWSTGIQWTQSVLAGVHF